MAQKKLEGAGLRGQVAGKTSLCTVGKEGAGLTYRGFSIELEYDFVCALKQQVPMSWRLNVV